MTDTVTVPSIAELPDADLTQTAAEIRLVPVEGIRTQHPHQTMTDSTTELNRLKPIYVSFSVGFARCLSRRLFRFAHKVTQALQFLHLSLDVDPCLFRKVTLMNTHSRPLNIQLPLVLSRRGWAKVQKGPQKIKADYSVMKRAIANFSTQVDLLAFNG